MDRISAARVNIPAPKPKSASMIFLDALWSYFSAWSGAFGARGRRLSPLTPRRLVVLALAPLGLALQVVNGCCLALDHLLFPGFRRTRIERPVFIVGVPRSGTTFLHRRLATDAAFTTTATWELLLAPSIVQRRLVALAAKLDRALGQPLGRALGALVSRAGAATRAVHEIGLREPEEDYLALLGAAGCFFAVLAFPHSPALRVLGDLSQAPAARRERLLKHYHALLQRHVYARGQRQLLSKNAAFASWLPFLAPRYPGALFVICIRNPQAALSSQLSSLAGARAAFASLARDADHVALFSDCYRAWFAALDAWTGAPAGNALIVEQEDLRAHPNEVLARLYARLGRAAARPASAVEGDDSARCAHRHAAGDWRLGHDTVHELRQVHARLAARSRAAAAAVGNTAAAPQTARAERPRRIAEPAAAAIRVAFFSDAFAERNGTGAYYCDLLAQLGEHVEAFAMFQPGLDGERALLSMPMPGDNAQRLVMPPLGRIRAACARLRPTVVVVVTPGLFGLLGIREARRHGAALISAFHTDFEQLARLYWTPVPRFFVNLVLRSVNRIVCRASRAVLVNNAGLRADVERLGARAVEVIGTPLPGAVLSRARRAIAPRLTRVCFAGRLAAEKNVEHIIAAARVLPDIEFVIGGDGPRRAALKRLAAGCPNVRFTGWLSREALVDLLDSISLLLLPSAFETFGSVALEAMARGRPALVSTQAGIHAWPALQAGLFVVDKPESLAAVLAELQKRSAQYWAEKSNAAHAVANALNRHTIRHWVELLGRYQAAPRVAL